MTGVFDCLAVAGLCLLPPSKARVRKPTLGLTTPAKKSHRMLLLILACGICISVGIALPYFSRALVPDQVAFFDPRDIGQRLTLLSDVSIDADLSHGDWLILLVRPGCRHCEQAFAELSSSHATNRNIAVIDVASHEVQLEVRASWRHGTLRDPQSWFVETPAMVRVRDGEVVSDQIMNKFWLESGSR